MDKLYVINKFDNCDIIKFNTVSIIEENEKEFILLDKIQGENIFLKENLDKEFEFLYVTKNKRKIKKQLKRIYNNIENNTSDEISSLEYKINELKEIKERNKESYDNTLKLLSKKKQ